MRVIEAKLGSSRPGVAFDAAAEGDMRAISRLPLIVLSIGVLCALLAAGGGVLRREDTEIYLIRTKQRCISHPAS